MAVPRLQLSSSSKFHPFVYTSGRTICVVHARVPCCHVLSSHVGPQNLKVDSNALLTSSSPRHCKMRADSVLFPHVVHAYHAFQRGAAEAHRRRVQGATSNGLECLECLGTCCLAVQPGAFTPAGNMLNLGELIVCDLHVRGSSGLSTMSCPRCPPSSIGTGPPANQYIIHCSIFLLTFLVGCVRLCFGSTSAFLRTVSAGVVTAFYRDNISRMVSGRRCLTFRRYLI